MSEFVDRVRTAYQIGGVEEAARFLEPLAEAGDPEAQYWMGCMYFLGFENPRGSARSWFARAAEQGHVDALYRLTGFLEYAEERAVRLRAAQRGSVRAFVSLGVDYATQAGASGPDLEEARKWYLRGALAGEPTAQYEIGLMLIFGEGGDSDTVAGLGWLLKAAGQGTEDAIWALANVFESGAPGVRQNEALARMWRGEHERACRERTMGDPIDAFVPWIAEQER